MTKQSAAQNAGIAAPLTIRHHWSGVGEPERFGITLYELLLVHPDKGAGASWLRFPWFPRCRDLGGGVRSLYGHSGGA